MATSWRTMWANGRAKWLAAIAATAVAGLTIGSTVVDVTKDWWAFQDHLAEVRPLIVRDQQDHEDIQELKRLVGSLARIQCHFIRTVYHEKGLPLPPECDPVASQ